MQLGIPRVIVHKLYRNFLRMGLTSIFQGHPRPLSSQMIGQWFVLVAVVVVVAQSRCFSSVVVVTLRAGPRRGGIDHLYLRKRDCDSIMNDHIIVILRVLASSSNSLPNPTKGLLGGHPRQRRGGGGGGHLLMEFRYSFGSDCSNLSERTFKVQQALHHKEMRERHGIQTMK